MKRLTLLAPCLFLIAGGVLLGCENQVQAPEALTLQTRSAVEVLPANARFVGMMNLETMQRNTAFNPFDAADLGRELGARIQDFTDATGFNPETDLREVYFAVTGIESRAEPSFVAYATFDRERLHEYIEQNLSDAFVRGDYKGVTIYRATEDGDGFAFALATDNMMVGSPNEAAVEAMLDRLSGQGQALKDDAETMALIASASAGSSAWLVARAVGDTFHPEHGASDDPMGRNVEQIGQALDDVAVSLTMEKDGAEGRVLLNPKEGVSASDIADLTKGVVAAMKASSKVEDAKLQMLDRVRVRTQGDQVRVTFFVDNALLASMR